MRYPELEYVNYINGLSEEERKELYNDNGFHERFINSKLIDYESYPFKSIYGNDSGVVGKPKRYIPKYIFGGELYEYDSTDIKLAWSWNETI